MDNRLASAGNGGGGSGSGFPDRTKCTKWIFDHNNTPQDYIAPEDGWLSYTISGFGLGGQYIKINGKYALYGAQISSHEEGSFEVSGMIRVKKNDVITVKNWYATDWYAATDESRLGYARIWFYPCIK